MVHFAVGLPLWGYALVVAAALLFAWLAYARVAVRLTLTHRAVLTGLRASTLLLIVVFLLRPVQFVQSDGARDSVVAVLVDTSRSMRLQDGTTARIERARTIAGELQDTLRADFQTELLAFGESLVRSEMDQLAADARRSDLSQALTALADRFRGRRLAGVVVISDGGDTSPQEAGAQQALGVPVFAVGVGDRTLRDREVINLTAGEPLLTGSSVDLSVAVTSSGLGAGPIELRLAENGRPIDTRRVAPAADGAPVHQVFTVSPSPTSATVYTVSIPPDEGDAVVENNTRSVVVPPQGRKRRVLLVEGAPGFEHTFLKRALSRDPALEVDSVVRKGQNEEGRDTFFIQAASSRAAALANGFPTRRADLFAYDAVFFGNIEGDFFTRDQLAMTADFVAMRGGGVLVFGARSFERAGLAGTALEEALPVDLTDRRATVARAASGTAPSADNTVALTADGAAHPATRVAATVAESENRWRSLPPLPSVAAAGAPRPGAQVLAVTGDAGTTRPLLVTQRYGQGRSMIFAGEATWRWRMMRPASDTTHELVWRQLARWVTAGATDAVEIPPASVTTAGTTESISVLVRDDEFTPVGNAEVALRVLGPGGEERVVPAALSDPAEGRYAAAVRFDQPGVYRVVADVLRGSVALAPASRPLLVGGVDVELSEPRLNEAVLRRIADATGGQYVHADEAGTLPALLQQSDVGAPPTEMRDLWHNGFSLALIVSLLAAEWMLRRRVGLA